MGSIEESTVYEEKDAFGNKQIKSKVCCSISEKHFSCRSSNNYSILQYNCKPTSFRSQIPRTISSTGCSNCRMETCLKGEEVEDACLFVGTKVFLTGTNIKAVVSEIVEYGMKGYTAKLRGVTFAETSSIDLGFSRECSVFSFDC